MALKIAGAFEDERSLSPLSSLRTCLRSESKVLRNFLRRLDKPASPFGASGLATLAQLMLSEVVIRFNVWEPTTNVGVLSM